MNRFFTLLLAASCLTAVGQVTYPYNPDGNADGDIAVGDLQDFLTVYGNPFSPSEIMVGDSTLTSWVAALEELLSSQQNSIDSIVNSNAIELALTRHSFNWHQPDGISNLSLVHAFHYDGPIQIPEGKSLYLFQAEGTYEITLRNGESYLHQIELGGFENHPLEPGNQTAYFIGDVESIEFNAGDPSELIRGFIVDSKVDKAYLNLENGPFTVPDDMMLVVLRAFECISDPFCANDIYLDGQLLSASINADGPNTPKNYRAQIFESGEALSGAVRLDGYLAPIDHFSWTNNSVASATSISIDYVSDTVLVGALVEEIQIAQPSTPSAWLATHVSYVNGVPTSIDQTCQNEEEVLLHLSAGEFLGSVRPIYGTMTLDLTQVESSRINVRFNQLFDYTAWENLASQIDNLQMPYWGSTWRLNADYPQVSAKDSFYSSLGEFDQSHREWNQYGYPNQPPSSYPSPAYYGEWELIRLESGEWVPADNY